MAYELPARRYLHGHRPSQAGDGRCLSWSHQSCVSDPTDGHNSDGCPESDNKGDGQKCGHSLLSFPWPRSWKRGDHRIPQLREKAHLSYPPLEGFRLAPGHAATRHPCPTSKGLVETVEYCCCLSRCLSADRQVQLRMGPGVNTRLFCAYLLEQKTPPCDGVNQS